MPIATPKWQDQLKSLKQAMQSLAESDSELFHQVVVAINGLPSPPHEFAAELYLHRGYGEVVGHVSMPQTGTVEEHHFFFGQREETFLAFENCLDGLRDALQNLPRDVVPVMPFVKGIPRKVRNLTHWMRSVTWIACNYPTHLINYNLVCAADLSQHAVEFQPAFQLDLLPGFELWPYLTFPRQQQKDLESWVAEHERVGVRFPAYLSAYCEKNVFFTSANAITAIFEQCFLGPNGPITENKTKRSSRKEFQAKVDLLEVYLYQRHVDNEHREHIVREDLATALKCSPVDITRRMQKLMGTERGMKAYESLCSQGRIMDFLKKNRQESPSRERHADMDRFASRRE